MVQRPTATRIPPGSRVQVVRAVRRTSTWARTIFEAKDREAHAKMRAMSRFIELSHAISPGMKTYPGLPEPRAEVLVDYDASRPRYQNKSEFLIASLHLCGNTGTYVDAPIHRFRAGAAVAALPLERLADLRIELIDASTAGRALGSELIQGRELRSRAVLFRSDFSLSFGTDRYFRENPFLTEELCR